jgi:hypothetical protein
VTVISALVALALAQPAFGTPEFVERAQHAFQTERPITIRIIDAARAGNATEFQQYVAAHATISLPGDKIVPFTISTISDLAKRCYPGDREGVRILPDSDEISVYRKCAGESSPPMTRFTFKNDKVVDAETGPAVVYVLPSSNKSSN